MTNDFSLLAACGLQLFFRLTIHAFLLGAGADSFLFWLLQIKGLRATKAFVEGLPILGQNILNNSATTHWEGVAVHGAH